jgi:hypothetical protein
MTHTCHGCGAEYWDLADATACWYGHLQPDVYSPAPLTGGSVDYYKVRVDRPTSGGEPYVAECNDIIEALNMNYAEGNAFKAIWRSCAARNLGLSKDGYKDGVYDAEKVLFFGGRMLNQAKNV